MTPKEYGSKLQPDEKRFYDIQLEIMWQDYLRRKKEAGK